MAWGIDFKTTLTLTRQEYSSIDEVEMQIKEYDKEISNIEVKLKMLISSTPKDIIPDDWKEEPINWLNQYIDEEFTCYQETLIERFKLYEYREYLKENNKE
jgi:hypothetical protein